MGCQRYVQRGFYKAADTFKKGTLLVTGLHILLVSPRLNTSAPFCANMSTSSSKSTAGLMDEHLSVRRGAVVGTSIDRVQLLEAIPQCLSTTSAPFICSGRTIYTPNAASSKTSRTGETLYVKMRLTKPQKPDTDLGASRSATSRDATPDEASSDFSSGSSETSDSGRSTPELCWSPTLTADSYLSDVDVDEVVVSCMFDRYVDVQRCREEEVSAQISDRPLGSEIRNMPNHGLCSLKNIMTSLGSHMDFMSTPEAWKAWHCPAPVPSSLELLEVHSGSIVFYCDDYVLDSPGF